MHFTWHSPERGTRLAVLVAKKREKNKDTFFVVVIVFISLPFLHSSITALFLIDTRCHHTPLLSRLYIPHFSLCTPLFNSIPVENHHMLPYRVSSLDEQQVDVACYKLGTTVPPANAVQALCSCPPPPYEKVTKNQPSGMLTRIWSGYVWNRKQDDSGKENDNNIGVFDKKLVEQALTLINIATEMDQSGNHKMAADLYLMGLDRILYAIPGK